MKISPFNLENFSFFYRHHRFKKIGSRSRLTSFIFPPVKLFNIQRGDLIRFNNDFQDLCRCFFHSSEFFWCNKIILQKQRPALGRGNAPQSCKRNRDHFIFRRGLGKSLHPNKGKKLINFLLQLVILKVIRN